MALKQALEEVKSKYTGGNIVEYIIKNRSKLVKKHDLSGIDVSRLCNQARRGVNMGEIKAPEAKAPTKKAAVKKPAAKKKTAKKK